MIESIFHLIELIESQVQNSQNIGDRIVMFFLQIISATLQMATGKR